MTTSAPKGQLLHEYKADMVWPARSSVVVEVCKAFSGGQAVPGYAKQLLVQMQGWVPKLPVPPTATIDEVADAAWMLAQQIGGSTAWVHVREGSESIVLRLTRE